MEKIPSVTKDRSNAIIVSGALVWKETGDAVVDSLAKSWESQGLVTAEQREATKILRTHQAKAILEVYCATNPPSFGKKAYALMQAVANQQND